MADDRLTKGAIQEARAWGFAECGDERIIFDLLLCRVKEDTSIWETGFGEYSLFPPEAISFMNLMSSLLT